MSVRVPAVSLLVLSWCSAPQALSADPPKMVADLGVSTDRLPGSRPQAFTLVAHGVVFVANGDDGSLFVTDGNAAGTRALPIESAGCSAASVGTRASIGGRAILEVYCGGPREIWSTDGSEVGTQRIFRFEDDSSGPTRWVAFDGRLFRLAWQDSYSHGLLDLYVTDGTPSGSRRVVHREDPDLGHVQALTATRSGLVFFEIDAGAGRSRVWASGGTEASTYPVAEFDGWVVAPEARATSDRVFFAPGGEQLWATDGTIEGTSPLTEFSAPGAIVGFPDPAVVGETFHFLAFEPDRIELWASDGTREGTRRVSDVARHFELLPDVPIERAGGELYFFGRDWDEGTIHLLATADDPATTRLVAPTGIESIEAVGLLRLGDRLLLSRFEPGSGGELWSLAAPGGALELLVDSCPGPCSGAYSPDWRRRGTHALFLAGDSREESLWWTDGTAEGTRRVTPPGSRRLESLRLDPRSLDVGFLGNYMLFAADDGATGLELARASLEQEGIERVADLRWDRPSAGINVLGGTPSLGGRGQVLFGSGDWVYATDGSEAGTIPLVEPPVGCCGLFGDCGTMADVFDLGERILIATGDCEETEIWSWDRASEAISKLFGTTRPDRPAVAEVKHVRDGRAAIETPQGIWTTDGTDEGTELRLPGLGYARSASQPSGGIVLIEEGPSETRILGAAAGETSPTVLRDELGCAAHVARADTYSVLIARLSGTSGTGLLLATDGTVEGTQTLAVLEQVQCPYLEPPFVELGSRVVFALGQEGSSGEAWTTDGTAAGTDRLDREWPPVFADLQLGWHRFHDRILFVGLDGEGDYGLWITDGTAEGTRRLDELRALPEGSEVVAAGPAGDRFVLLAKASEGTGFDPYERFLWSTRGEPNGGEWVATVRARVDRFSSRFASLGSEIVFPVETLEEGEEPWRTDGTAAGTRLLADIAPGPASSHPYQLAAVGDRLLFSADDGVHGDELWTWEAGEPVACLADRRHVCLGDGRFRLEAFWGDFDGRFGDATASALTADTGAFWFFDEGKIELAAKVLDGRAVNGHHWLFEGSLSNVRYALTARDAATGRAWRSINPLGRYASGGDTAAFGPESAGERARSLWTRAAQPTPDRPESDDACQPGPTRLCLLDGRFAVEVAWRDFAGNAGAGQASPWPGGESGLFWFFDPANVELIVKMVDGTAVNGRHWVYFGALSNVEYTVTVTDSWSGATRTYFNPAGRFASVGDVDAF